jgi:hypothetical protein
MTDTVSEDRLRQIATDADNFYRPEIKSMASELLKSRAYLAATKPPLADVTVKALFSQLYDWFNRLPGESLGKTHFDALIAIVTASPPMPGRGEAETPDLALIEATARKINPGRSEDHIKSVALDALSIFRALSAASVRSEGVARVLQDVTTGWQTQTNEGTVPTHSRMVDGVLCRWWGEGAPPAGVALIDAAVTSPVQTREDGIREVLQIVVAQRDIAIKRFNWRAAVDACNNIENHIEALLSQPEPKGDKT